MTKRNEKVRQRMSVHHRRLFIAGCAALCLGSAAIAQEQDQQQTPSDSGVVGPPQLREFQLPGQRTTPTVDTPAAPVDIAPPPPKVEVPPPSATTTDAEPQPGTRTTTPSTRSSEASPVSVEPRTQAQAPAGGGPAPGATSAPSAPVAAAPQPAPEATQPQPSPQAQPTAVPPAGAPSGSSFPWLLLLLGIGAIAAAAFAFFKLRSGRDLYEAEAYAEPGRQEEPRPEPVREQDEPAVLVRRQPAPAQAAPEAAPRAAEPSAPQTESRRPAQAPAAQPAPGSIVGVQARPWLNLEFVPAQAAATSTEAVVQYELLLKNVGNTLARNIRVEARMFNAGADQDQAIADFFRRPLDERRTSRVLAIPARSAARMRNAVAMPNEELREINVQGRRLFIPMVAINVIYEWGEGKVGQTSMSYLVGREAETPTDKMGAFRLDLGPRVYRSVGQRPNNVAVLV